MGIAFDNPGDSYVEREDTSTSERRKSASPKMNFDSRRGVSQMQFNTSCLWRIYVLPKLRTNACVGSSEILHPMPVSARRDE